MEKSESRKENVGDISNLNQNLTKLYLCYNQLTSLVLPDNSSDMSNLIELHLNHNDLTSLPDNIGNISNLQNLYLHHNQLINLPEDIGNLSNLINLDISANQLTSLPESIGNLSSLTHLHANKGRQNDGEDGKFHLSRMTFTLLYKLISADLHGLITLPESIGNLFNLAHLDIADNQLISLPNSISNLSNLICLNLHNNQITSLPENIANLAKLQRLNLSFNELTYLPASIGNFCELLHLNLSGNKLVCLPESIGNFPKLTDLNLCHNHLASLPNSIGNLSSLTHLYLNANCLTSLPEEMKNLCSLTYLDLGNQLTISQEDIDSSTSFNYLEDYNNPPIDLSILQNLPSLETVRFMNIDLPRRYWTKLSEWRSEWLIDENNIELRQKLIERLGYDRICKELNAITVDGWREYTLLKIDGLQKIYDFDDQPIGVEPMMLLKMTCPSTAHIHILRVPPEMKSAEESITWVNHGIHPDRFSIQT
jgi:leucine-rich repeat protein SHOC2